MKSLSVINDVVIHKKPESDEIKYLPLSDIQKIIHSEPSSFWKMVFLFLFETGCRINEGRSVKFKDLNIISNTVKLITLKQRKPSFRVLKVSSELMKLILIHKSDSFLTDKDFIFSKSKNGKSVTNPSVWYHLRGNIQKSLGEEMITHSHSHMFRHSRSIHLLSSGMNIVLLKKFLGHSSINSTLVYLKYHNSELFDSIDKSNESLYFGN